MSNGARTIIVESPDRFARDLMVQLAGHDMLKAKGISLVAASAPTHFIEDTPTAILVRQVLGAIAEFEKRDSAGPQKSKGGKLSLRAISAALAKQGHLNERGKPFNPKSVSAMLAS